MQQASPSTKWSKFEKGDMVVLSNPEDPTMKSIIWSVEKVEIDGEDMTVEYLLRSGDGEICWRQQFRSRKWRDGIQIGSSKNS